MQVEIRPRPKHAAARRKFYFLSIASFIVETPAVKDT